MFWIAVGAGNVINQLLTDQFMHCDCTIGIHDDHLFQPFIKKKSIFVMILASVLFGSTHQC